MASGRGSGRGLFTAPRQVAAFGKLKRRHLRQRRCVPVIDVQRRVTAPENSAAYAGYGFKLDTPKTRLGHAEETP